MSNNRNESGYWKRFMPEVISVLKSLGGSGRVSEVQDAIATKLSLSDDELDEELPSGGSRFANRVQWAKFYLTKAGYIESSERGVWSLTEKGAHATLSDEDVSEVCELVQRQSNEQRRRRKKQQADSENEPDTPETTVEDDTGHADYRVELLQVLRGLPPSGFEKICQRLLREAGFQQVIVTGRSGDGGIDGHGVLQVNPFVSFKVYFQSKKYAGSVGASAIRDFRGAMQGRADKGIVLTTGSFTTDAKREAVRDGAPPIELVDANQLVDMFEQLKLGLRPIKTFEVVEDFFDEFRED